MRHYEVYTQESSIGPCTLLSAVTLIHVYDVRSEAGAVINKTLCACEHV